MCLTSVVSSKNVLEFYFQLVVRLQAAHVHRAQEFRPGRGVRPSGCLCGYHEQRQVRTGSDFEGAILLGHAVQRS